MKRRQAIRYLFITGTAMWVFPACVNDTGNSAGNFLNTRQQQLLEDIAETIIPSTNTPGARELGVHHFIVRMMQDCRDADDQKSFKSGLEKFESFVKKQKGASWKKLSAAEKQELLGNTIYDKNVDEQIRFCIKNIRALTIKGYKSSEYYVTKVQEYQMVPGHFYGCVKVKNSEV